LRWKEKSPITEGKNGLAQVVGSVGAALVGSYGPVPIGDPQKNAAIQGATNPTSGGGHGALPQPALPEARKSARLGNITRAGVKPGLITKFWI
jgi:hypothetical protein